METHEIHPKLLRQRVRILVVGCGGNGSAIAAGLPYLHQALLAYGHPEGIHVTLLDPDVISPTNCVRQPFSQSEIGLYKSVVLANRLNLFWGLDWQGIPERLDPERKLDRVDIVIGCVDTREARATIAKCAGDWSEVDYWLDLGNNADSGQFVLGEPLNRRNKRRRLRLRTVSELFPEVIESGLDQDGLPSCSAAEALDRQEPFVNPTLANHALALLARLFRYGTISCHGAFVSLGWLGGVQALPVDPKNWKRMRRTGPTIKEVEAQRCHARRIFASRGRGRGGYPLVVKPCLTVTSKG
jgi:PRTRC genetic system ThiF family protein